MNVKVEIKSPSKEFKIFLNSLNFAYEQFCFLEKIRENLSNTFFQKNPILWQNIRVSLLRSYLLELSKIFEKQKNKFPAVLSIYYLMDFEFRNHEGTLVKLNKLRNKFLVHTDLEESKNFEQFLKQIDLRPIEINELFKTTYEVATKIVQSQGLRGNNISLLYREIKGKADKIISALSHL